MTLVKGPDFHENETISLVSGAVTSAKLVGNLGAEMSYILDQESSKHFKGLFKVLEGIVEIFRSSNVFFLCFLRFFK